MRKSIASAQNFLRDKGLVARLVEHSFLTREDLVYEIGAGTGKITEELLKKSGKVVAFETDKNLFTRLTTKFAGKNTLVLRNTDFLESNLPAKPYKVFSNIPFNTTAAITKKLTQTPNPPEDTFLIVQKEAAKKFIGKPLDFKNSQMAILLKPWFEMTITHHFQRRDFIPSPNVDVVLLRLKKRETPLVTKKDKGLYEDFIIYTFNQFKPNIREGLAEVFGQVQFLPKVKPSAVEFETWLELFDYFLNKTDEAHQTIVQGTSTKARKQEQKIEKINRTRVDKNWREFKNT